MNTQQLIIIGVLGGVAVVILILIVASISSLEQTEYGLDYASISKTISPEPYTVGIKFLGLGHSFIKFPSTIQTVEFSTDSSADQGMLSSRTSDGLEVQLAISFQYKLIPEKLYDLYMNYQLEYKYMIVRVAIDSLTDLATKFTAYDFFMNRGKIGNEMQAALDSVLFNKTYCNVDFFQLRDVDLPDDFEAAIQLTEVKKQDIHKAEAEKSKIKVEIETKIMKAQLNMDVIINHAKGEASAILSSNEAQIQGFNSTEISAIEGYTHLKNELGMENTDLLSYIRSQVIKQYSGDKIIISV